jgi:hypothetical protein
MATAFFITVAHSDGGLENILKRFSFHYITFYIRDLSFGGEVSVNVALLLKTSRLICQDD